MKYDGLPGRRKELFCDIADAGEAGVFVFGRGARGELGTRGQHAGLARCEH